MGRKNMSGRRLLAQASLFAIIAISIGVILIAVSQIPALRRIDWLPLKELGFTALGSGAISIVFEYAAHQRRNRELASHISRDVTLNAARARNQIRYNAHIAIELTPWPGPEPFLIASVQCQHWTEAHLGGPQHFRCTGNRTHYDTMLRDLTVTEAWFFAGKADFTPDRPEVFGLLDYTINGQPVPIVRSSSDGEQTYTVTPAADLVPRDESYQVAYTYQALLDRDGHGLRLDIDAITRDLTIELTHTETGISGTGISHLEPFFDEPDDDTTQVTTDHTGSTSTITITGWVMPINRIGYLWTQP